MDQVFNEVSLSASLVDNHSALSALHDLGKASINLEKLGFTRQIRVTEDFETRCLAPHYTVGNYLHASLGGVDRTVQSFLKSRFSRAPYVEQLCEDMGVTELDDYHFETEPCKGLALAVLWGVPALSLGGDRRFVPPSVTIVHDTIQYSEDNNSFVQSDNCHAGIVCEEADVKFHQKNIFNVLRSPLCDGTGILENAQKLLPCLVFSTVAQDQLAVLNKGNILFPRIRLILIELNRAMEEVKEKHVQFKPQGFKFTPTESESATSGKNGEMHTFTFMDKKQFLCDSHMRITGGDRVYFHIDSGEGLVYVGHIGKHLPTKKFG